MIRIKVKLFTTIMRNWFKKIFNKRHLKTNNRIIIIYKICKIKIAFTIKKYFKIKNLCKINKCNIRILLKFQISLILCSD